MPCSRIDPPAAPELINERCMLVGWEVMVVPALFQLGFGGLEPAEAAALGQTVELVKLTQTECLVTGMENGLNCRHSDSPPTSGCTPYQNPTVSGPTAGSGRTFPCRSGLKL